MAINVLSAVELEQMLKTSPDCQVLDVRNPDEHEAYGVIANAKLIPLHELPYAFRTLDKDLPVVVVCQHGVRSLDASYFLSAQGFGSVYNLDGGMVTWTGELVRPHTQASSSNQ